MSAPINPADQFPHPELTAIPAEDKPTFNNLRVIHQQVNANAMSIPSTRGGARHGHLALVIPTAKYDALPNTIPWVQPVHPGPTPNHPAGASGPIIAEANRVYKLKIDEFNVATTTEAMIKKQVLEAVPDTYTKILKNDEFGYALVSVLEILQHLDTNYGTVTFDDLNDNLDKMNSTWSPTQPIEDLWNKITECRKYAAPHDAITEPAAVRAAIINLTNSGVFTDALKDWRKRTAAQQNWTNLMSDFNTADKERRRILTTKDAGYANAATQKPNKPTDTKNFATNMYYCWSHGLSNNMNHSSKTCTRKEPGHREDATADNMLGGCCIIRRRSGERAVYRRPERAPRAEQNNNANAAINDENVPPGAPAAEADA